jgi:hypothetical protein
MHLCVIPARGGSKRVPRKNIRGFCGKPMIAWSIAAAQESALFDRILVSTDDDEIAKVAEDYGAEVPFRRPGVFYPFGLGGHLGPPCALGRSNLWRWGVDGTVSRLPMGALPTTGGWVTAGGSGGGHRPGGCGGARRGLLRLKRPGGAFT